MNRTTIKVGTVIDRPEGTCSKCYDVEDGFSAWFYLTGGVGVWGLYVADIEARIADGTYRVVTS